VRGIHIALVYDRRCVEIWNL